jgi:DNA-binding CsgD family transcriptional regulator
MNLHIHDQAAPGTNGELRSVKPVETNGDTKAKATVVICGEHAAQVIDYHGVDTLHNTKMLKVIRNNAPLPVSTVSLSVETALLASLTKREKEILKLVGRGYTSKSMGIKLFISPETVKTHRKNIKKKLDIHSSAAVFRFAAILEILENLNTH